MNLISLLSLNYIMNLMSLLSLNYIMNLISLLSLKQEVIAQTLIYLIIKCMDTLFPL